ncbi:hypothetical protein IMG5_165010 [Ichthyophthirius multifiliis]|uniref:Transmembrane protein n=1 Tax=Ichthyophthirius multifiliis TaxID=5932 RepID=G0R0I1_ICHMU|nr:hypothetical protein IMG5_165010 [Ichthyophthirius multifiliis]EGR29032.1 hypothetical protein IMG5_165010 [Ichthyophthirius multifiliis]|eukprot:XP_004030268.1 hypothetical protein IMG5_165010 [Ichthyophthirius multifiliis]
MQKIKLYQIKISILIIFIFYLKDKSVVFQEKFIRQKYQKKVTLLGNQLQHLIRLAILAMQHKLIVKYILFKSKIYPLYLNNQKKKIIQNKIIRLFIILLYLMIGIKDLLVFYIIQVKFKIMQLTNMFINKSNKWMESIQFYKEVLLQIEYFFKNLFFLYKKSNLFNNNKQIYKIQTKKQKIMKVQFFKNNQNK